MGTLAILLRKIMKKIVVASRNPVKISAVSESFKKMFPEEVFEVEGISVPSGVSDQPMTESETAQGALNRIHNASEMVPGADFWVGIEGGVEEKDNNMEVFAWVMIKSRENEVCKGKTGTFILPPKITELIRQGKELGEADDIVFGRSNSKQENGAVGLLTSNIIDRTKYYTDAVILALIPIKNRTLYRQV